MKKKIFAGIVALVCALASVSSVFAEGLFSVTVDAVRDMFYMRSFFEGYAEQGATGSTDPATVYRYQGGGEIKSFQTSAFDDTLEAQLKAAFTGEHLGGLLVLKAGVADELKAGLSDWNAWMKLGPLFNTVNFRVLTGNTAQRGQVKEYQNFHDFLKYKVDTLGVIIPEWQYTDLMGTGNLLDPSIPPYGYGVAGRENKGYAVFTSNAAADLFVPAGTSTRVSGILADVIFAPVTVTASVGGLYEKLALPFNTAWPKKQSGGTYDNVYEWREEFDPLVTTGVNFAFRAEGAEIANFLTLAAVYKYGETSRALDKSAAFINDVIDEKITNHIFGLFANFNVMKELGITAGFSGQLMKQGNDKYPETIVPTEYLDAEGNSAKLEVFYPFYSGVDLRACYTGIEKLIITLNNNVSFASAKGTAEPGKYYVKSWAYESQLVDNSLVAAVDERSENYFGLYNALGLKYSINERFTADFQVANQLGLFSLKWEHPTIQSYVDTLGLYAGVTFSVLEKAGIRASLQTGPALKVNMYSFQDPSHDDLPVFNAGFVDFGIPLSLKVEY